MPKALRIRRDPVIEAMAEGLGARVIPLEAPFNPEGGAYVKAEASAATPHGHDHHHDHGHAHDRDHERHDNDRHGHAHDHGAAHANDHHHGPATIMDATAPEADGGSLLPLLIWLSPSFPVGAFAYSHGLEWAVEAGDIVDARSLEGWLIDLVEFGAPRSDAILFSVAFRSAAAPIGRRSWKPTLWRSRSRSRPSGAWKRRRRGRRLSRRRARPGIASLCGGLMRRRISASPIRSRSPQRQAGTDCRSKRASRRSPSPRPPISSPPSCALGRSDRRTARRFSPRSCRAFGHWRARPTHASLADLGQAAFRSDIAAMRHESQYSRLFRS